MAKRVFDRKLLNEILSRDGAELIEVIRKGIVVNSREEISCHNTSIKGICNCGNLFQKGFYVLVTSGGAYCKKCVFDNRKEKTIKSCTEKYGVENPSQSEEIKLLKKETTKRNYGVENPFQSEILMDKAKQTNINKYGHKHPTQSIVIKEKTKQTNINKYGVEYAQTLDSTKDKIKATCLKRYGVEYSLQSEDVKSKSILTNLERYGVENPSQNQEIMEKTQKNAKKYKKFTMPSGEIRKVQGYEPFALTELIKLYSEDEIKTDRKKVPRIPYEISGKKRYHFPDIFIPHENKLIEVKSTWTYRCNSDNVLLKKKSCEDAGYIYEIWVYDSKGNRIEV
jgi:hypothetical protein